MSADPYATPSATVETPTGDTHTEEERNTLLVAYILHVLSFFTGFTGIAGVIVNHIKVNDTSSVYIRSHHSWLIRTFWWSLLWYVVSAILVFVLIGFVGLAITFIWHVYRLVRGMLAFSEKRPIGV